MYKLNELLTLKYGKNQKNVESPTGYPIYGTGGIIGYANRCLYNKESILFGRKGTISRVQFVDKPFWCVDTTFYSIINENIVIPKYLFYKLSTIDFNSYNEGTTIPSLRSETLNEIVMDIHNYKEQQHIVNTIGSIDDLIEICNKKINKLTSLIDLEYKNLKVDFIESTLEKEFEISIGRTPPRDEKKWFSLEEHDYKWVSIKDMGEKPLFIYETNEKLTKEAINKFNFIATRKYDILMSFKLTVGKISIAGCNLVTNEAIATFKPKKEYLRWYLYCYLKNCNFTNAGSTSSIATAINSTILKKYKFPLPNKSDLIEFNNKVSIYINNIDQEILKIQKLKTTKEKLLIKFFK